MSEPADKLGDGIARRCSLSGGVGQVQVGLIRPGLNHRQAHPAALVNAGANLSRGAHALPWNLGAGTTQDLHAAGKVERVGRGFLGGGGGVDDDVTESPADSDFLRGRGKGVVGLGNRQA
jgi:hypothetical protein